MPTTYSDFRPTQFDHNIRLDEHNDWLVAPVIRNRDSGILIQSNWECQLDALDLAEAVYEVRSFGHWANGWFEIVLVHPDHAGVVEELEASLADYPILSEAHYSNAEWEVVHDYWGKMSLKERIDLCQREGASIFSARHESVPTECYERIKYWVNEG